MSEGTCFVSVQFTLDMFLQGVINHAVVFDYFAEGALFEPSAL